jgi:hypothetical protein
MDRTFNYIDKKGRFYPWLDKEIENSSGKVRDKLVKIKHLCEDGLFDWQPSE